MATLAEGRKHIENQLAMKIIDLCERECGDLEHEGLPEALEAIEITLAAMIGSVISQFPNTKDGDAEKAMKTFVETMGGLRASNFGLQPPA